MQAGNRNQVIDPGAGECTPLFCGNGGLVTDYQCADDMDVRPPGEGCEYALADKIARRGQAGSGRMAEGRHAFRGRPVAHITRRADTAFQHPGFQIETVRVGGSVRLLQPYRHAPLLARPYARGRLNQSARPIPRQLYPRRDTRIGGQHCIHLQQETFAACILLWQIHYRSD